MSDYLQAKIAKHHIQSVLQLKRLLSLTTTTVATTQIQTTDQHLVTFYTNSTTNIMTATRCQLKS